MVTVIEKEKVIQMTNAIRNAGTSSIVTEKKTTRSLLVCGVIAGPFYLVVGLLQAFTRPGFDLTRHSLSLLSNGDLGWIHITNLVVTGLLTMAGAVGIRQALRVGVGHTWGPLLIGLYGLSLIGAGVFVADPALGFPPGTPADANEVSWHGLLHLAVGGVGFLALIAACFVLARRFASQQQRGWMIYSVITGVVFFAAFIGIAAGQGNPWTILGFWIGVVLAWSWISALSARLMSELPAATP
jgi:hypothetical membrane protein